MEELELCLMLLQADAASGMRQLAASGTGSVRLGEGPHPHPQPQPQFLRGCRHGETPWTEQLGDAE